MKWFRVENFAEAWRPVYRLTRLLSFTTMTYSFKDHTASRTSTDQTLLVVGVFVAVMGLYYTFAFYQERIMMVTNSHIISAGRFGLFVIIILLHIATLAINYVNGTRIAEFPRTIQNIDRQISTLFHHTWNYQKEHLANIVFIVIRFAEWFVIIRILQYTIDPFGTAKLIDGLIMTTAFNWVNIGYQVNAVSWLIILGTIRKRFSVLNHHLRYKSHQKFVVKLTLILTTSYRMTLLDDSIAHKDPHQFHRLTVKIGILHSQLCDTVDCFNHCHSTTMMFSLAPAFGFTVFSWFGLIHAYAARVDELVLHSWTTVTLSFNYISFVFYVVLFSARVNYQVNDSCDMFLVL
nr:uncharacterized protein LOC109426954 [Aedes albopictus]